MENVNVRLMLLDIPVSFKLGGIVSKLNVLGRGGLVLLFLSPVYVSNVQDSRINW